MSLQVILYSKPGCHLCESARAKLAELQAGGLDLAIEERDITADPALFQEFRYSIPVIEVNGQRLEAPISNYRLEQVISA